MTVSVVQQAVPTVAGVVGTSCSVTLSSPPTVGNQLALWLASGKPGTDFPTNLSAWTLIGNVSPFTSAGIWLYTKTSDGSETTTSVTFNLSAAHNIAIQEWPAAAQFGTISDGYLSGLTSSASLGPTDAPPAGGGTPSMFVFDNAAGDTAFAFPAGWTQAGPYPTSGFPYYSDIIAAGTSTQTSAVTAACTKGTRASSLAWTNVWVYATGGATTVALTGEAETSAAGTVAPSQSSSLTGQGTTGAQGSLTAGVSIGLAGQAATASQGSIAASAAVALAGQAASFAQGTLTAVSAGVNIALTGNALAASAGTMQSAGAVTVAGQSLVSSTGVMVAQSAGITLPLAGEAFSASAGTLAPQQSLALTGLASGVTAGTMTAFAGQNVTVAIAGIGLAAAAGTVAAGNTVALTGQRVQAAVGSLATFADLALASHPIVFLPGSLNPRAGILVTEPGRTALFPAELRIATFPAEQRTARFVV